MASEKHFKYVILGGGVAAVRTLLPPRLCFFCFLSVVGMYVLVGFSRLSLFCVTGIRREGVQQAGRPARGARHHLQGVRTSLYLPAAWPKSNHFYPKKRK